MDIEVLLESFDGAFAPNTLRAYRADFAQFALWCAERLQDPWQIGGEPLAAELNTLVTSALAKVPASLRKKLVSSSYGEVINREVIEALARSKAGLTKRYGVNSLALFGSVARGTAGKDSDIDVLVGFDGPATSERYFGVQFYLEDLFGKPVDLITERALRPELKPFIDRDRINV